LFTQLLAEFLFRLTFGVAAAMAATPSRCVTSGFFRVHLWVLMGLQTLAALSLYSGPSASSSVAAVHRSGFWLAVCAAVTCYLGAVVWMYEQRQLGKTAITAVTVLALAASCWPVFMLDIKPVIFQLIDRTTSGLLLGLVTTSMLLGHWYLNTPTMKLEPLKRLIILLAAAIGLRAAVCLPETWLQATADLPFQGMPQQTWIVFVLLRWLSGLIGVLGLTFLTWQTLKIPNTQSATGILYAGVVLAFIGELTSLLLSARSAYPV
jgi:hypothetical protein